MAAFAGVISFSSCKDDEGDDNKPEPTPVPVPVPTPVKVIIPDEFFIGKDTLKNDTVVVAKTLLSQGKLSDSLSVFVTLHNGDSILSTKLSMNNSFLGTVDVNANTLQGDSTFTASFPAIEGDYTLSINDITKTFSVKSSDNNFEQKTRSLSNFFNVKLTNENASFCGMTFEPYNADEDRGARFTSAGDGKFIALTEDGDFNYNNLVSKTRGNLNDVVEDNEKNKKDILALKNTKQFIYVSADGKSYLCKVTEFAEAEATELTLSITF